MKTQRILLVTVWVAAALLAADILLHMFSADPVAAAKEEPAVGRYQISSWATQTGSYTGYSGYYIVDTTTGKIVEEKKKEYGGVD